MPSPYEDRQLVARKPTVREAKLIAALAASPRYAALGQKLATKFADPAKPAPPKPAPAQHHTATHDVTTSARAQDDVAATTTADVPAATTAPEPPTAREAAQAREETREKAPEPAKPKPSTAPGKRKAADD